MAGSLLKGGVFISLLCYDIGGGGEVETTQSRAEIYLMALEPLSKAERKAVIARLLEDDSLRQDILDVALIRQRQGESSSSFRDYLADSKAGCLRGAKPLF
jgi:hypothetical protein